MFSTPDRVLSVSINAKAASEIVPARNSGCVVPGTASLSSLLNDSGFSLFIYFESDFEAATHKCYHYTIICYESLEG